MLTTFRFFFCCCGILYVCTWIPFLMEGFTANNTRPQPHPTGPCARVVESVPMSNVPHPKHRRCARTTNVPQTTCSIAGCGGRGWKWKAEVDHQLPPHSELEVVRSGRSLHSEQRERETERERQVPAPDQQYFNFNYTVELQRGEVP